MCSINIKLVTNLGTFLHPFKADFNNNYYEFRMALFPQGINLKQWLALRRSVMWLYLLLGWFDITDPDHWASPVYGGATGEPWRPVRHPLLPTTVRWTVEVPHPHTRQCVIRLMPMMPSHGRTILINRTKHWMDKV